jgi:hypothetical protein
MAASACEEIAGGGHNGLAAIREVPAERHGEVVGVAPAQVVGMRIAVDGEVVEPHL